ncbi:diaminopimelate dehydrogenase [Acholeplasma laidlawii]|uniref:Meso-diaminopimelate D-dehydrogenase n=2 Tax=Acholeplasma laidlawii TaxID=2148 RepID=A9NG99_ACHLI|nr:diaminopimelate dehydrogenase [Acholeplasma laidlawii]ABX81379.1 meso-diaminopimelate dehydrogenase [Acholeplasma laidlawii PG-8A]NWH10042.1 diaminopimelate dehydrogenase [Acholeplasma laidlawii]NWH11433.1 diaminopimelate dehydrogenase [Acholeplasma laidlawii]NWH13157.1 diaminopimelate dehydrogenase [Acholeplasma laidlawii]NWH14987.1 diaminopimelate dehydrogenase [Acholeplasma laidlawii]
MSKIKIAIIGYGNLGKSIETGLLQSDDMELFGVFTRRDPKTLETTTKGVSVYHLDEVENLKDRIDVAILCGGSMSDLPVQGPLIASLMNTVDGYDNHALINEYFNHMDEASKKAQKLSVVASGWDPGMFSINRILAEAILPVGETYTFWGEGVSQGHSDAIRRVSGVKHAVQYTVPIKSAIDAVKNGDMPTLSVKDKHKRICYVVAETGADLTKIEHDIKTMPNYFEPYETKVHFISHDELLKNHQGLPHGGLVIRYGQTGLNNEHHQMIQYQLKLDSNPDFTARVLLAYARAAYRLNKEGASGAKTIADIAPAYLINLSAEEIRKKLI